MKRKQGKYYKLLTRQAKEDISIKKYRIIICLVCMFVLALSLVPSIAIAQTANNNLLEANEEFVENPDANTEFYAVYNTADEGDKPKKTLSFYYDDKKATHTESTKTVYADLPVLAAKATDWSYNSIRRSVKNVSIDASVANYTGLKSTAHMFEDMQLADDISGCEYLDVSNVTNMSGMFKHFAFSTKSIIDVVPNVSAWDTSNVTDMSDMFNGYACYSYFIYDVPNVSAWNTANVTDMSQMFKYYASQNPDFSVVPDVSNWSTSNVTSMKQMFYYYALRSVVINTVPDVSKWDTSNVEDLSRMFLQYAYHSEEFSAVPNVSYWNTHKVKNMSFMFSGYAFSSTTTLQPLDLSKWSIDALEDVTNMFHQYAKNNELAAPLVYGTDWSAIKESSSISSKRMFIESKLKGDREGDWNSANTSENGCFTQKTYTVCFDGNSPAEGAELTNIPASMVVNAGSTISKPALNPSCTGYVFEAWYKEASCENAWNFVSDTVDKDTTLYAKWTVCSSEDTKIQTAENDSSSNETCSNSSKTGDNIAFVVLGILCLMMLSTVLYIFLRRKI